MEEFRVDRSRDGLYSTEREDETIAAPANSKELYRVASSLPTSGSIQVNIGRVVQHQWGNQAHDVRGSSVTRIPLRATTETREMPPEVERSRRPLNELLRALGVSAEAVPPLVISPQVVFLLKRALESFSEPPTVLETFEGYVDSIDGDTAYVTLESRLDGDVLYGEYSAPELLSQGIGEQTRFLCETVKGSGAGRVRFTPLPENEVTDEEAHAIAREAREAFPGDDDTVLEY